MRNSVGLVVYPLGERICCVCKYRVICAWYLTVWNNIVSLVCCMFNMLIRIF